MASAEERFGSCTWTSFFEGANEFQGHTWEYLGDTTGDVQIPLATWGVLMCSIRACIHIGRLIEVFPWRASGGRRVFIYLLCAEGGN